MPSPRSARPSILPVSVARVSASTAVSIASGPRLPATSSAAARVSFSSSPFRPALPSDRPHFFSWSSTNSVFGTTLSTHPMKSSAPSPSVSFSDRSSRSAPAAAINASCPTCAIWLTIPARPDATPLIPSTTRPAPTKSAKLLAPDFMSVNVDVIPLNAPPCLPIVSISLRSFSISCGALSIRRWSESFLTVTSAWPTALSVCSIFFSSASSPLGSSMPN